MYRVVYNTHIGWRRISLMIIMPITAALTTPPPMQQKGRISLFFESTSILGSELQLWPCVCTNPPLEMSASILLRRRGGAGTRQHHDLVQKRTLRILCTTPRRRMLLQKIIFALLMHSVSARDIATHSYHLQKQIFLLMVNQSESLIYQIGASHQLISSDVIDLKGQLIDPIY